MPFDAVSKTYVLAGLRIGQDIDGFVDSYYGPQEFRDSAMENDDPWELIDGISTEVSGLSEGSRRLYFEAQLQALQTVMTVHNGQSLDYRRQVQEIYGIVPEFTDESYFAEAHDSLDRLLPGEGSLHERLETYRKQFTLKSGQLGPVTQRLTAELRNLTGSVFTLPEGESASISLIQNQPWSGYNWYLGNLQSKIEINTDLPVRINSLPDLVAHEIYCGHHTEHSLKEHILYRQQGFGESSIALLTSTQAVISEGIATSAFEFLVPQSEQSSWLYEHCYGPAGIETDVDRDLAITNALKPIRYVSENAALLLHDQDRPESEVVDYICKWGLRDRNHAQQTVNFITTPILRTYIFCYARGFDLVQAYLDRVSDRRAAFWSLLTEHWTPQMLRDGDEQQDS